MKRIFDSKEQSLDLENLFLDIKSFKKCIR